MKNIQGFLKDCTFCEVNGDLVSITHTEGWLIVRYREPGNKKIWEYHFPEWNISMVRISAND